jgi:hypothetical protein
MLAMMDARTRFRVRVAVAALWLVLGLGEVAVALLVSSRSRAFWIVLGVVVSATGGWLLRLALRDRS